MRFSDCTSDEAKRRSKEREKKEKGWLINDPMYSDAKSTPPASRWHGRKKKGLNVLRRRRFCSFRPFAAALQFSVYLT